MLKWDFLSRVDPLGFNQCDDVIAHQSHLTNFGMKTNTIIIVASVSVVSVGILIILLVVGRIFFERKVKLFTFLKTILGH